ncbi:MAG: ATP-dependent RNA helicase DbpA [Pseudomonadales bacterium]
MTSFSKLGLKPELLATLDSLSYTEMTPIQQQSLPEIIKGRDLIGQGKTGSGKTAAFGLGLLEKLDVKRFRVQALVLCPTRELADQVAKEIRRLARGIHNIKVLTLCGGMPFGPQIGSLEHGAHIIVGTPGRVDEHLRKGNLKLENLSTLVLDEADRMLEMGFTEVLNAIVDKTPKERQTLLFSATFPDNIKKISSRVMNNPVTVKVESTHSDSVIEQRFFEVDQSDEGRLLATRLLLHELSPRATVIFCNTKRDVQQVADELDSHGFSVLALHGDLEQRDRDSTLMRFSNESVSVLVATDVAARGLDIDTIDLVINYHVARDIEVHTHRIGRTGRAGNTGLACSLFSRKERYKMKLLEDYLDRTITPVALPEKMMLGQEISPPTMKTLQIDGGKKQKLRPGDILGALTGKEAGESSGVYKSAASSIAGSDVGKITVFDNWAYVAVKREVAKQALQKLSRGKMKGRSFRIRQVPF